MTSLDWIVLVGALALIGAILWFFFFTPERTGTATANARGHQDIEIEVRGGYSPNAVHARAGVPLTLIFNRQDDSPCSEEIVIADFGVRRFLPAYEKTRVEIPAPTAGRHEFTCGMGMLHGSLIVQ